MQRSVALDRKQLSVVENPRGVGDTRSRRPDDEERGIAELLRDADPTQVRIARAVAVLGPAATAGRVAALLDAESAEHATPLGPARRAVVPPVVVGVEQEADSLGPEATGGTAASRDVGGRGRGEGPPGLEGTDRMVASHDARITGRGTAPPGSVSAGRAEGPPAVARPGGTQASLTGRGAAQEAASLEVEAKDGGAISGDVGGRRRAAGPLAVQAAAVGLKAARRVAKPLTGAALGRVEDSVVAAAEIPGVLAELATTGLFEGERCTDPAVAARILRDLSAEERRELHGRAAEVLHGNGFPSGVIAPHLVAAGDSQLPWAADVLIAAAEEAVGEDQLVLAAKYLELAYRASGRARERAAIAGRLVSVEWRINPSSRTRNFGRLRAAVNTGLVPHADLSAAVLYLLWHGCVQHADRALTRLDRSVGDATDPRVDFLCAWLRYTHPTHVERHQTLFASRYDSGEYALADRNSRLLADRSRGGANEAAEADPGLLAGRSRGGAYDPAGLDSRLFAGGPGGDSFAVGERDSPHRQASELLAALSTQRPPAEIASAAQRLLSGHRPTLSTIEPLVAAVDCLIHTDRLDLADAWCTSLLAEAAARHAPTWRSIFAAARAETLLRKGNLADAAENAVLALNLVPAEHLGVWAGRPIGVLVRALTAQGKHAEAAAQLRRAVPRAMFDSRFALGYLTAYGEHCLATGRADEALRHFRQCGNLMRQWGMDYAWLTPWRNHMAAAYLAAGRPREARAFASMHLDLIGGADGHRTGGVSLRLVAATSDPHRRVSLLRRAVAVARAGDGDLELAAALGDLGRAYRSIGDADRARPLLREATRLAEDSGAELLLRRLRGDRVVPPTVPLPRVRLAPNAFETLSPAERRVAELAALGQRNRDIATALAITTSTVEQHLTKVYRKLSVARRSELRFVLAAYVESTRSAVG